MYHRENGSSIDGFSDNETELVYYSIGNERWGSIPVINGVGDLPQPLISVYPTLNTGEFNITLAHAPAETHFRLFDIYGREIHAQEIHNRESRIMLKEFTPGFYIWQLTARNKTLRSGKVVMQGR